MPTSGNRPGPSGGAASTASLTRRTEGGTELFLPEVPPREGPGVRRPVFYNPANVLDRDLAVAVVRALPPEPGGPLRGWEVTAATGVRGLRLVTETDRFGTFDLTESHPDAYRVLRANSDGRPGVRAILADARVADPERAYDYVDVDPYGSPLPFLASALPAVATGGILAVTATDLMVLAGAQPTACLRRYGSRPVAGRLGPEGGLRILVAHLVGRARANGRSAYPLLGYVLGHHVRVYLRVLAASREPDPIGTIEPSSWTGPLVGSAGPYGPFWLGPLLDPALVRRLDVPPTAARAIELGRLIERFREESAVDRPFYYEANVLAGHLGLARPPALADLRVEIARAGYRTARTHARPEGFRTDAPRAVVEAAVRTLQSPDQSQNARVRA